MDNDRTQFRYAEVRTTEDDEVDTRPPATTVTPAQKQKQKRGRSKLAILGAALVSIFALYSLVRIRIADVSWNTLIDQDIVEHGQPVPEDQKVVWRERREEVKKAFLHAWNSYEKFAWGADELKPLTSTSTNNFNGWGVTIVDSLDTLLLMDLRTEFSNAMNHVEKMTFNQKKYESAQFFETIIRYVGGLLSAHALIIDDNRTSNLTWRPTKANRLQPDIKDEEERKRIAKVLLDKAELLARAMLPAINSSSGMPAYGVNTANGNVYDRGSSPLAEIGSFQMEYKYLAHVTGEKKFFDVADKVTDILHNLQKSQLQTNSPLGGMLPTSYRVKDGAPTDEHITLGSLADSAYEYFLKGYLLSGRYEKRLLEMYLAASRTALEKMLFISPQRGLTYLTDLRNGIPNGRLEHLSCFFPGLLSLGIETLNPESSHPNKTTPVEIPFVLKDLHYLAAEGLSETCYLLYADNPTHLSAEEVYFFGHEKKSKLWWDEAIKWENSGRKGPRPGVHGNETENASIQHTGQATEYYVSYADWRMRPETIESLFLMHRQTRQPIWRERCYNIFKGVDEYSRLDVGFASVHNASLKYEVGGRPGDSTYHGSKSKYLDNSMPSYALAETFKYLYLCMMEPEEVLEMLPVEHWVFNTEAHPLPVFEWTQQQKSGWKIH